MIPPIFATLSANAGVTAIIGDGDSCRCYPFGFAKQGTTIPYVTWLKVSGQPLNKLFKGSFTDKIRAQVDCWGADGASALALARAVRASLETSGCMIGLNFTERDAETRLYRYSMDFEFIVNRSVAGVVAPVADFVGSVVSGNAPLTVNFTDLSTNTPTSWSWDFGDATTSAAQNPTKIYTVPGVYTVTLIATNAAGPDTRIRASYIVASFDPASLFTGGYTGGYYDPSDLSTLWQDSARTTPVTADGQTVGAIDDKSGNGNHLTQATAGARPLYKTSGGLHWLEFDGVNDVLASGSFAWGSDKAFGNIAASQSSSVSNTGFINFNGGATGSFTFGTINPTNRLSFNSARGSGSQYSAYTNSSFNSTTATLHEYATDIAGATLSDTFKFKRNNASITPITQNDAGPIGSGNFGTGVLTLSYAVLGYCDGKVWGSVVINRQLTGAEGLDLATYLASKSGITL